MRKSKDKVWKNTSGAPACDKTKTNCDCEERIKEKKFLFKFLFLSNDDKRFMFTLFQKNIKDLVPNLNKFKDEEDLEVV